MSRRSKNEDNITSALMLAMKTGQFIVGFRKTLKAVVQKKARCIVVCSNYKPTHRKMLEYYSVLAGGIPILFHDATNRELGNLLEAKCMVGCIAILDQGEADLIPIKSN
jgi:large subunit ribosomal protein L30e